MIELQKLKTENERWHEEHVLWVNEALHWEREIQLLVALLYKLDRALPEHSLFLSKHVISIREHEELIKRYEMGLDERAYRTCVGFDSEEEFDDFHQRLCKLHGETDQVHRRLSVEYAEKMFSFRALAKKLLD